MKLEIQNALAVLLLENANKDTLYQILIHDNPVSFKGVRLFKTEGAAKTSLTNAIKDLFGHYNYHKQYVDNKFDPERLKKSYEIIDNSEMFDIANNFGNVDIKSIRETLLKSGVFKIVEVK